MDVIDEPNPRNDRNIQLHKASLGNSMTIDWQAISSELEKVYRSEGYADRYRQDENYLRNAFSVTELLWETQFRRIEKLRAVMISEAPLFGEKQTYIYSLESKPTAFFHFQDLCAFPGYKQTHYSPQSTDEQKQIMFDQFAKAGFLVLDIFPFALNKVDTVFNFQRMSKSLYRQLLSITTELYLVPKLDQCLAKFDSTPNFVYRYKRLFKKTENHLDCVLATYFPAHAEINLNSINGTNMSLDRNQLAKALAPRSSTA